MGRRDPVARLRHDMRTPINHIVGYTELLIELAMDENPPARTEELTRVLSAAKSLLGLIDDTMVRARLESLLGQESAEEARAPLPEQAVPEYVPRQRTFNGPRGRILIVDDNQANCEVLQKRLEREGHRTAIVNDGERALELLAAEPFDLVLLDILMPGLDGHTVLARIKLDETLRHLPVIMISALDEMETVVRCIEIGAEDYLPKPFDPTLLRARIGASLEKKALRDAEQAHLVTIEKTQERLAAELSEASAYVRSTLPAPWVDGAVRTDWRLVPSTELGGDALGYHWVDEHTLAAYVLDVSGHGVGAALLSATAIKVLLSGALPDVDFHDPGAVLTALNEKFPMEAQNNMFFTIWYGVLDLRWGTLTAASAGHPPAILIRPGETQAELVGKKGMVLGGMPGTVYTSTRCSAPPGSKLFLVSDGAYEIHRAGELVLDHPRLTAFLTDAANAGDDELDGFVSWVHDLHGPGALDDDLTILKVRLMQTRLTLRAEPVLDEVPKVNERVEEFLESHSIASRPRHALIVALEELFTNIVKYGYAGAPGEPVAVAVQVDADAIELTVADRARAFDPLRGAAPDLNAPVESRDVGGLGLHLLRKLSLRQSYERRDGQNVVTLVFAR